MGNNILNGIFGGLVVIGFSLMLGTAGASDLEKIDFGNILFQTFISMIIILIGFIGLNVINREEID